MGGHTAPVKFPTVTVKFWSSNFWAAKRDFRENATPDYGFSASQKEKGSPDRSLPLIMKKSFAGHYSLYLYLHYKRFFYKRRSSLLENCWSLYNT